MDALELNRHYRPKAEVSRYKRRYHLPETPYQRVMTGEAIPDVVKRHLDEQHQTLNPFELKRQIEAKLKRIFLMVSVTSNVRQRI